MKRPSFQFYPADWRQNANLRRCSEAARGAWMDILCALHDSDEYGVVRWPLAELARAAGTTEKLALELAAKDVLKGSDKPGISYIHTPRHAGKNGVPVTLVDAPCGPCWFSSRMVTDEWRRGRSGGETRFTTTNQPAPSTTRRHGVPLGDGATSSSSSSSAVQESNQPTLPAIAGSAPVRRKGLDEEFEQFWKAYKAPPNSKKPDARKAWEATASTRPALPDLLRAVDGYLSWLASESRKQKRDYPKQHPSTWLRGEVWGGFLTEALDPAVIAANMDRADQIMHRGKYRIQMN